MNNKNDKNQDLRQENLEDTLEFLSLDDETIEKYTRAASSLVSARNYEEDYEEDYEDEDYEDEDYDDVDDDYEDIGDEDDEDLEELEDYEDEDYDDIDDDEDEYYEDEEPSREDGLIPRVIYFVTHMSTIDRVVAIFGFFIIIVAAITGTLYVSAKTTSKQVEAFAEIGNDIEGIGIIGESGLIAVSDAESARLSQMIELEQEQEEEKEEETKTIEVGMNITSIQSDIKIKFVNKETNKLIANAPFEVEVSGSKGKTFNLKDDDKDGIIYQTKIDADTYTIKPVELKGEEFAKYHFAANNETVKVTDTIAYKKVDVADEIKSESEVNAAAEDTAQQTVTESALTDTVEWVESTKTEIESDESYKEINISDIPDPSTSAKAAISGFIKLAEVAEVNETENQTPDAETDNGGSGDNNSNNGGNTGEENTNTGNENGNTGNNETGNNKGEDKPKTDKEKLEALKPSLTPTSVNIKVGESVSLIFSTEVNASYMLEWSSSNTAVAVIEDNGTVTGIGAGSATVTATIKFDSSSSDSVTLSCSVTVKDDAASAPAPTYKMAGVTGGGTIKVGKTCTVSGTTEPEGGKITWSSSNTNIATVDNKGLVTGISTGTVAIIGTSESGDSKELSITVEAAENIDTNKKDVSNDTKTKLKDKKGNQIYIKNSDGKYVEAVYSDYFKNNKFYLKSGTVKYRYTGWQTIDGYTYFFDKNGNYVTGEQVIQGAKYNFGSDGRLSSGSGTMGIDVSKHNGTIDWNAVKNSGVSFVIIRCGYRGSATGVLVEDPMFRSNIKGAKAAGLKVGVYFFCQAVNEVEAVEEASMAVGLVSGYGLDMPIFLDVESAGGRGDQISKETRTAVCRAFCQTVQNSGYSAGIYANKTWLNEKINISSLTNYKIWLAQYASTPTYTTTRYDMWQYSSKGRINGISTNVDLNIRYY